jgi:flagellin
MSTVINTNLSAIAAQNSLRLSGLNQTQAMERLSSGTRINNAKDDAAGLAISTRMTSNIRGIASAIRNANDGISLTQTAEGSMASIQDNLQRIRELAVQAANDTNQDTDRTTLDNEAKQLVEEIDRVAANSKFNGISLLSKDAATEQSFNLQVGPGANEDDVITVKIKTLTAADLAIDGTKLDLADAAKASANLEAIDAALIKVTDARADMGAYQNRLTAAISNLENTSMNLTASRSRILDTDYAKETTNLAKAQIIQQAATAMLAQANQSSQSVLALLK